MVKVAGDENRQRGEFLAVFLGADIGGEGHLADIEGALAHHFTYRDQNIVERGIDQFDLVVEHPHGLHLAHQPVIAGRHIEYHHGRLSSSLIGHGRAG